MNTDLLSPTEVSQWLRTPISTLARWRCEGTGPSYLTLGRRVLYRQQDIEKFLDASLHQTQCVGLPEPLAPARPTRLALSERNI